MENLLSDLAEQAGYAIVAIGAVLIVVTLWMISKTGTKRKGKKTKRQPGGDE